MGPGDEDRRKILLRRAAFVGTALAALGCRPDKTSEAPGSSGVVSVPPEPAEADDAGALPPKPREPKQARQIPSLEIPDNVGKEAQENFKRLFDSVKRIHPLLDAMEALVPDCSIRDPKCESRWRQLAAKQNELREIETFLYTCPGTSPDAKLYAAREREHLDLINERKKELHQRIQAALTPDGEAGGSRWDQLEEEAYNAAPYPCLSVACREW